ncbi:MAG: DUF1697 domain-containing protein [Actinobacteria bacterium]|nr:DUF1697 domain-containing protein [Actinomycetota bacterium]
MSARYVGLLRGINVGTAKRVSMHDLRAVFTEHAFTDVQTLLNSGNVVFGAPKKLAATAAAGLSETLAALTGVSAKIVVLTTDEMQAISKDCALLKGATDPRRHLVAVPFSTSQLRSMKSIAAEPWGPEAIAIGQRAVYLWCPDGLTGSKLAKSVERELGADVTIRNQATISKIMAAL